MFTLLVDRLVGRDKAYLVSTGACLVFAGAWAGLVSALSYQWIGLRLPLHRKDTTCIGYLTTLFHRTEVEKCLFI